MPEKSREKHEPDAGQTEAAAARIRIRELNDAFRQSFTGGRVVMTQGVSALPEPDRLAAIQRVKTFDSFDADNDPHGEHDFGSLSVGDQKLFWKIDYYDASLRFGSEAPADPGATTRVLTIMLAEEY